MKRKRKASPRLIRKALTEFVNDVQALGEDDVRQDWPDLYATYEHALKALGMKTTSETIIDSYPKGLCPDCQRPIPKDVRDGEECGQDFDGEPEERDAAKEGCGHVFVLPRAND